MSKFSYRVLLLALLVLITSLFSACSTEPKEPVQVEDDQSILGTFGQIRVFAASEKKGIKAIEAAFKRIQYVEDTMSTSVNDSDVHQINQAAGEASVKVAPETIKVIEAGIKYHQITGGRFNILLGSLIELWGIGKPHQKVPTDVEIDEARKHIDIQQIEITNNKVHLKDSDMLMDLGGIAKGYAVDEAVKVLKDHGVKSGFVNMGGDVYAIGSKPDGSPWYIGVQNPIIGANNSIIRVPLVDRSIVTSGDYERYFVENGERYHHIIDPATGKPSRKQLVSVTILSDKGMDGDALSTAVFVMGLEEGLAFIEAQEGIDAILITKDKEVYVTTGIKDQIEIIDNQFKIAN
ncbi:FAD:protein FMN transferase [Alkaliphilus serpentinus]|uniref:FAD:protein FMN transferase n=1 Tax=Alkaliphilus serpentinus TaxID=1482731 RepID=A0A833M9L8_9FIRM|nr:FAD:protein FMN transferase [Alkaliphilus serpentinus]KAB3530228.1 FAD:protein FMN transferase [Alkaliphilus serpentinus]